MGTEVVQTAIVRLVALAAAAVIVRRLLGFAGPEPAAEVCQLRGGRDGDGDFAPGGR